MYSNLGISTDVVELVEKCENDCLEEFAKIDEACTFNSLKVFSSFHKNRVAEAHFNATTG